MGATHRLACAYAGVSEPTFYTWLKAKPEFSESIKRAEGAAAVSALQTIATAANNGTWQAAAWLLERRYPQEYGRRVEQVHGPNAEPFTFTIGLGDDDVRERLHHKLDELAECRRLAAAEG
jgi:hypothetical protein